VDFLKPFYVMNVPKYILIPISPDLGSILTLLIIIINYFGLLSA